MHIVVGKVDRVIYQVYGLGSLVVAFNIPSWGYYHCEFHRGGGLGRFETPLRDCQLCLFLRFFSARTVRVCGRYRDEFKD